MGIIYPVTYGDSNDLRPYRRNQAYDNPPEENEMKRPVTMSRGGETAIFILWVAAAFLAMWFGVG